MATITDSWADIKAAILGGTFSYAVGDTKQFTYGDGTTNYTVEAEVRYIDTTNKFVDFVAKLICENNKRMSSSGMLKYSESLIKGRLDTIYSNELPSELKNVIIQKCTDYYCYDETIEHDIAYLWVLNSKEAGFGGDYLKETEGIVYYDTKSSRKKGGYAFLGSAYNSNNFLIIDTTGSSSYRPPNDLQGLVFGFRIGDEPDTYQIYGDQKTLDMLVGHELTEFKDSRVTQLGSYAFYNQSQLTKVKLPACTSIDGNVFSGCSGLTEIWLGSTVPSVMSNSIPSQFSYGIGAIYVPQSAVATYRADSSWAAWKWHIVAQEDYPVTSFDSIQDSLSEMCTKLANGTASYDVGDFKTIDLGTEGQIRMQVAAKNVDELSTGGSNAAYTWVAMDLLSTDHRMNPELDGTTEGTGAIGGWGKSEMRTYLSTDIWTLIPSELKAVIKEVKKYSCIYDTNGTKVSDDVSNDKLWIPSNLEVFNDSRNDTTGPSYTGIFTGSTDRARKKPGASSTSHWWTRSATSTSNFRYVQSSGVAVVNYANISYSVLLGFCT